MLVAGWHAIAAVLLTILLVGSAVTAAEAGGKFAAITVDARNGKVLFSEDADGIRHPASLTKMMTLYVLFQDLKSGKIKLNSPIRMSARAAAMAPSKLGVRAGSTITVETAIKALVVKSANDVAAAVAENLGGTESAFARRMTGTARAIGMNRTTFANASGLPNPAQVTTARDMATLGLRLMRDFPQYYPYFRTQSFVYGGRNIRGHNRLLGKFDGTDGIKTGYINASGFNLVSSVRRGDRRVVGVVLGGRSGASRDSYMRKMIDRQFAKAIKGKSIAAVAGSSKGAINPVETAEATPNKKTRKSIFGGAKPETTEPAPQVAMADEPVAPPEQGDTDEQLNATVPETPAPADQPAIAQVEAAPAQPAPAAVPKVVESNLVEPQAPAKLPFEVKAEATQPEPVQQPIGEVEGETVASLLADQEWSIQIGAYSTKKDAQARLNEVRKSAGAVLAGKSAITVTVQKGKDVTYRARFSGFNEADAKAACKQIGKRKTSCYVLAPAS
jgi:D-alanyl-D-alanine carboxypeptidase